MTIGRSSSKQNSLIWKHLNKHNTESNHQNIENYSKNIFFSSSKIVQK